MKRSAARSVLFSSLALVFLASPSQGDGFPVTGRVVDESGEPVAGARVVVTEPRTGYRMDLRRLAGESEPETVARAVSGADGWYRLELPRPGRWRIEVSASGYVPMEHQPAPFIQEERLWTVTLARDAGLEVTVVDERGEPVPGAWLSSGPSEHAREERRQRRPIGWVALHPTAQTDEQGRLRLPRVEGKALRIRAWHPGRLPSPAAESSGEPVRLTLPAGVPATVEVRDDRGKAAVGAVVRRADGDLPAGVTGDDGRVTLTLPAAARTKIQAETTGGGWGEAEVASPVEPGAVAVLRLAEPVVVRGRVVDSETGGPVPAALAFWLDGPRTVVADRAGYYELRLPRVADVVRVLGAAPGYRPAGVTLRGPDLHQDRENPDAYLALLPARPIAGRVVTETGEPLAGASVWLHPRGEMGPWSYFGPQGPQATDSTGGFVFIAIPHAAAAEVVARAPGLAPASRDVLAETSATGLTLVLHQGASLAGRVVDAQGQPLPGARVSLAEEPPLPGRGRFRGFPHMDGEPRFELDGTADAEGRFRLTLLPAGRFASPWPPPATPTWCCAR